MFKKKTIVRIADKVISDEIKQSGIHPVLQSIYSHRDIVNAEQINYSLQRMLPLDKLKGLTEAIPILKEAVEKNKKILIVGDFDADGATSTAVCHRALTMMGAQHVAYLVPNRFDFGYGLTPELVEVAKQNMPDILITVDNGISSIAGVKAAIEAGIKVVVTDHHLAGDELPEANAIINPNQPGCEFPSKNLAGVGVIFYVMLALRQALRDANWFNENRPQLNMANLLDIVALGTVADVVPLDDNNRILVAQGIKRIQAGQCCVGIQALLQVAGRDIKTMVSSDLGFSVGPRLNAAGRLEDMSLGIECLLTDDMSRALHIAQQLDELNKSRREIEQGMQQQAMTTLKPLLENLNEKDLPKGLCIFDAEWHQGVIGILASRIKEKFNRPVIAFASSDNGEIKGSARSIKGLHIRDALDVVDKKHPGIILKFGGHAMAAGLTIKESDFEIFKQAFNQIASEQLSDEALQGVIESDGELNAADINLQFAEELRVAGPWGQHFSEPVFDGEFEVTDWRVVGERHLKMQLATADSIELIDAIAFNMDASLLEECDGFIHAAYRLDVNSFRNKKSVQLMIEYFESI